MRVFISWSGNAERAVAEALKDSLEIVCNGHVQVFVSSLDIAKGDRGLTAIASSLSATDYGLVVVSRANQNAPWINFEAGALGRALEARVATVLVDLLPSDLTGPVQQFQATQLRHDEDLKRLLREIAGQANGAQNPHALEVLIKSVFDGLSSSWRPQSHEQPSEPQRDVGEMVAEIVSKVRSIDKRLNRIPDPSSEGRVGGRLPKLERDLRDEVRIVTGGAVEVLGVFSTLGGTTHVLAKAQSRATSADRALVESVIEGRVLGVQVSWHDTRQADALGEALDLSGE
ncbi:toll/interleukin-1 receptor domain-containing protein [Frigoribacterium sp. MCBA15_019]|uniref:toll/interleukin-1 receptor domain-containing protein n=1 Tax=Frigoribacterium sp. MCBA15_019 TaxID=1898745 RepID=UPI0009F4F317|nr:toll/interleukin-1 receptor domain-containing protein [Frigoribacterium sp. MCBA15_019]